MEQAANLRKPQGASMSRPPNERWSERVAAKRDLDPWIEGGLRLEKTAGSAVHRLWDAAQDGRALWMLAAFGTDSTVDAPEAQSFVVQHNWAAAFEGATDFELGDFRLPYDVCCFEFRISGKRICAFVSEKAEDWGVKQITIFVETGNCWVVPVIPYSLKEGLWRPLHPGADKTFSSLIQIVAVQVRAICISLEAEVAAPETVARPREGEPRQDATRQTAAAALLRPLSQQPSALADDSRGQR